ncbi:MAG: DEAD/DEAH box helicase [Candidatus Paceibacterota bacterium]
MNTATNRRGRRGSKVSSSRPSYNTNRNRNSGGGNRGSHAGGRRSGGGNRGSGTRGRKMATFDPSQFINTNPIELTPEVYVAKNRFSTFGVNARLVRTIESLGMTTPTPIQDQIIPEIMNGRDVIGLAETGTGKTAAFLIPLIEKTLKEQDRQTLILAPTRELALQIEEELKRLSQGFRIFSITCVGGMNIRPQINALKRKNHFVIGTPGRVLDLINRKNFTPKNVTTVVLDEADRMLDMGFIHDMREILSSTPADRETLFFSATMSDATQQLVKDFLHDPVTISVKKKDVTNSIEQDVVPYELHTKFETLTNLLEDPEFKRVIVFGSMKHSVEKLAKQLSGSGIVAESIHGNKTHGGRQHALKKFKSGNARVLVATDVAARGIHVENVTHVINYDLPNTFDDYVHRIGRTGRVASKGKALTFIAKSDRS